MARSDNETRFATFWQLKVLEVVARADTWDEAEAELGLNKYQIDRLVRRLAVKLNIERGLLVELDGKPHVPDQYATLVDEVAQVLFGYDAIEEKASLSRRFFIIRIDGYWSHIERFWGSLIGEFEQDHEGVRIELVPWFGKKRDNAGIGMALDLRERKTDLVLGPYDPALDPGLDLRPTSDASIAVRWDPTNPQDAAPRPMRYLPAYRWALAAAIAPDHELRKHVTDHTLDIAVLADASRNCPLVVAPPGHISRKMIERYQTPSRRFHIASTSPEPAALVALGSKSNRVPIIPTDSLVEWDPTWPILVTKNQGRGAKPHTLGGSYAVYWREKDQPEHLVPILREFATVVASRASAADPGQRSWGRLPQHDPSTIA